MTIAPGTNNVKFFDGKLQSSTPVSVRKITVTPAITGTGITAFVNDQLSVKLNGSEIATLTSLSGAQVLTVSFAVDATSPAVITIEASTKNSANIIPSSTQFTVALTDIRDSSNNPITPANLGAGSSLTGDTVTIKTAEVEIKTATLAAPSNSKIYSNTSSMEIGRFSISSMNESARLHRLVVVNTGSAILQNIIIGNNIKLYDISTGYQISATATIN